MHISLKKFFRIRAISKLLGNGVLQSLAGLEHGQLGSGDLDLFLGAGIAADAGSASLGLEGAKANQLDLLALSQGLGDDFDGSADNGLSVLLGQTGLLGNGGNEFSLINSKFPPKYFSPVNR